MAKQQKLTKRDLELYSSAYSLSDMEIFIFPELMYSLVLANIMSPLIWEWRKNPWFDKIEKKSFNYRVNRVKQYIMDHYVFNLDLDTWGLTTKEQELSRFRSFVNEQSLSESNALFGYQGDKYYFDIDIRRHFGLDKYTDDVIPYWKTETVEAMTAFKRIQAYTSGAGECVSLSALYVAAMFIVGRIPLEKMFMIATPLHSQNFIAEKDGLMTNNRRIVTKAMWYNGTELSAKARRAVEKEKITIVSHHTGFIHTLFKEATISPEAFAQFKNTFEAYLETEFTFEIFINFLYSKEDYWGCFQYEHIHNGKPHYTSLTSIFNAQRSSKNRFGNESREALMGEMEMQEFSISPLNEKILINRFEEYMKENAGLSFEQISTYFLDILLPEHCYRIKNMFDQIKSFIKIIPRLPKLEEKELQNQPSIDIDTNWSREEVLEYIESHAKKNKACDLALHAFRAMDKLPWEPFLQAALKIKPVSVEAMSCLSADEVYQKIQALENESIYDGCRLAQPDEVWNFGTGEGTEKALLFANILYNIYPQENFSVKIGHGKAELVYAGKLYSFVTEKLLSKEFSAADIRCLS